jgi:hypothetical protein
VAPIEEQHARPEVDGVFESSGEIPIQALDQERFDTTVLPGASGISGRGVVAFQIGH